MGQPRRRRYQYHAPHPSHATDSPPPLRIERGEPSAEPRSPIRLCLFASSRCEPRTDDLHRLLTPEMDAEPPTASDASGVDLLVLFGAPLPWTDELRAAVDAFRDRGGPVLGVAIDGPTSADDPAIDSEMLGVEFWPIDPRESRQLIRPAGVGREHPITASLEPFWAPPFGHLAEAVDEDTVPLLFGAADGRADGVAWLDCSRPGPLFHTALGADLESPPVRELLRNAARWLTSE